MSIDGGGKSSSINHNINHTDLEHSNNNGQNSRIRRTVPQKYIPTQNNSTNKSQHNRTEPKSITSRSVSKQPQKNYFFSPHKFLKFFKELLCIQAEITVVEQAPNMLDAFENKKSLRPNSPIRRVDYVATENTPSTNKNQERGKTLIRKKILSKTETTDKTSGEKFEENPNRFRKQMQQVHNNQDTILPALKAKRGEKEKQIQALPQRKKPSANELQLEQKQPTSIILPIQIEDQDGTSNIEEYFEFEVCPDDRLKQDDLQNIKDSSLTKVTPSDKTKKSTSALLPESPPTEENKNYHFVKNQDEIIFPFKASEKTSTIDTQLKKSPILPVYKQPPVTQMFTLDHKPAPTNNTWRVLENYYLPVIDPFNLDKNVFKNILDCESTDIETAQSIVKNSSVFNKLPKEDKKNIQYLASKHPPPAKERYSLKNCANVLFSHATQFNEWNNSSYNNDELFLSNLGSDGVDPEKWIKSAIKRDKFYSQRKKINAPKTDEQTLKHRDSLIAQIERNESAKEQLSNQLEHQEDPKVRKSIKKAHNTLTENIENDKAKLREINQIIELQENEDPLYSDSSNHKTKYLNRDKISLQYNNIGSDDYETVATVLKNLDNGRTGMTEKQVAENLLDTHLIIRQIAYEISKEYDTALYASLGQEAADDFKKNVPLNHEALEKIILNRLTDNIYVLPEVIRENCNEPAIRDYINKLASLHTRLADHPLNFSLETAKQGEKVSLEHYALSENTKKKTPSADVDFTIWPTLRYNPGKNNNKPSTVLNRGIISPIKTQKNQIEKKSNKTDLTKKPSAKLATPSTPKPTKETNPQKSPSEPIAPPSSNKQIATSDDERLREIEQLFKRLDSITLKDEVKLSDFQKRYNSLKNGIDQSTSTHTNNQINRTFVKLKDDMLNHISEVAGYLLTSGNTNIANLSDPYRPEKLSEHFTELYDGEWTNIIEHYDHDNEDKDKPIIQSLHQYMLDTYDHWMEQREDFEASLNDRQNTSKNGLKNTPTTSIKDLLRNHFFNGESLKEGLSYDDLDTTSFTGNKTADTPKVVSEFMKKANRIIAEMVCQDPPCVIENTKPNQIIDGNVMNLFTKTGTHVDYSVWPALRISKGGAVLKKGSCQPYTPKPEDLRTDPEDLRTDPEDLRTDTIPSVEIVLNKTQIPKLPREKSWEHMSENILPHFLPQQQKQDNLKRFLDTQTNDIANAKKLHKIIKESEATGHGSSYEKLDDEEKNIIQTMSNKQKKSIANLAKQDHISKKTQYNPARCLNAWLHHENVIENWGNNKHLFNESDSKDLKQSIKNLVSRENIYRTPEKLMHLKSEIADISTGNMRESLIADEYAEICDNNWSDLYEAYANNNPSHGEKRNVSDLLHDQLIIAKVADGFVEELFENIQHDSLNPVAISHLKNKMLKNPESLENKLEEYFSENPNHLSLTTAKLLKKESSAEYSSDDKPAERYINALISLNAKRAAHPSNLSFEIIPPGLPFRRDETRTYKTNGSEILYPVTPNLVMNTDSGNKKVIIRLGSSECHK